MLIRISRLRAQNINYSDARVKLTGEVIKGIRTVKSYGWEDTLKQRIIQLRELESSVLRQTVSLKSILVCILSTIPSIVSAITLGIFANLGNTLTPAKVFTALALFGQVRFPLVFYPTVMNAVTEGLISARRLESFLTSAELCDYIVPETDPTVAVRLVNASFTWSLEPEVASHRHPSILNVPELLIKKGELVVIRGVVGSGKKKCSSFSIYEIFLIYT